MDKLDNEKFAELEEQLADRQSRDERLLMQVEAVIKDDLLLLDEQLKESNIQGKIDQIVGWYNYKLDEANLPQYRLRVYELINPVTQLQGTTELDMEANYNEHHSLLGYEWSNESRDKDYTWGEHWINEFNSMKGFKIHIICKADKGNSEHSISFKTNFEEATSDYLEYEENPTVVAFQTQLQAVLIEMLHWYDKTD